MKYSRFRAAPSRYIIICFLLGKVFTLIPYPGLFRKRHLIMSGPSVFAIGYSSLFFGKVGRWMYIFLFLFKASVPLLIWIWYWKHALAANFFIQFSEIEVQSDYKVKEKKLKILCKVLNSLKVSLIYSLRLSELKIYPIGKLSFKTAKTEGMTLYSSSVIYSNTMYRKNIDYIDEIMKLSSKYMFQIDLCLIWRIRNILNMTINPRLPSSTQT